MRPERNVPIVCERPEHSYSISLVDIILYETADLARVSRKVAKRLNRSRWGFRKQGSRLGYFRLSLVFRQQS